VPAHVTVEPVSSFLVKSRSEVMPFEMTSMSSFNSVQDIQTADVNAELEPINVSSFAVINTT
jgi:hypothetical protein